MYGHASVGAAKELDGGAGGARRDDDVLGQLIHAEDPARPPGSVSAAHPDERPDLGVRTRHAAGPLLLSRAAPHRPLSLQPLINSPPSPPPPAPPQN